MKILNNLYKYLGDVLIKTFILFAVLIIPLTAVALKFKYDSVAYGWFMVAFIFILSIERTWETFYSFQEKRKHKLYGDWTLAVVSVAYILLIFTTLFEFFVFPVTLNITLSLYGLFLFIAGFLLRLSGIKTLNHQWTVHAVGASKIKDIYIVKSGPYKYMRHPIYLGVILEVLSIPLIWNAYLAFFIALALNVPLQIIRAYLEEKTSLRRFGADFTRYLKETPAFFPYRITKRK
ncbi:MAG: isoprenylcysteine carboxylmethyltransferase family protein [Candidatus Omnitrophota bacterium]